MDFPANAKDKLLNVHGIILFDAINACGDLRAAENWTHGSSQFRLTTWTHRCTPSIK